MKTLTKQNLNLKKAKPKPTVKHFKELPTCLRNYDCAQQSYMKQKSRNIWQFWIFPVILRTIIIAQMWSAGGKGELWQCTKFITAWRHINFYLQTTYLTPFEQLFVVFQVNLRLLLPSVFFILLFHRKTFVDKWQINYGSDALAVTQPGQEHQSAEGKSWPQAVAWPHHFFIHHWISDGRGIVPFVLALRHQYPALCVIH